MKALHISWLLSAALLGTSAPAQMLVSWNFGDGTASLVASSGTPVDNLAIGTISSFTGQALATNTTSPSSGYAGASGGFSGSFGAVAGAFNVSSSSAFTVTLTPLAGYQVSVSSISWGNRSTGTGPTNVALRTSADGFAADAFSSGVVTDSTWALINSGPLTNVFGTATDPLTLRIHGYGGTSAAIGNWRIDDLSMNLSLSAVPEPSTYAALAGALSLAGAIWHRRRRRVLPPTAGQSRAGRCS